MIGRIQGYGGVVLRHRAIYLQAYFDYRDSQHEGQYAVSYCLN